MDWYKSQLITTAILAAWNIGVAFALLTGILSVLVMQRLGVAELGAAEASVVTVLSLTVGITVATVSGRRIMPAIRKLSRTTSTLLLLVLVMATFMLFPTRFAFMTP